jgi:gamma-glutamylcyclotransferase
MQMVWYFAYGSNMNAARLAERKVRVGERVCGRLDGWRLSFNKLRATVPVSGAGNIVPAPGEAVFGTLNETDEAGLVALDVYEGVKTRQYHRQTVTVVRTDTGQPVEAVTYVALNVGDDDLKPLRDYLAHLLAGRDLLPADYCALLERQKLAD